MKNIQDLAKDNDPIIYFNRNAGQVWNTSMQHAVGILNYSNKIKNDQTKIVFVGDHDILNNTNRFNLDYLQNKYNKSVEIENNELKIQNGKFSYIHQRPNEPYNVIPSKEFQEYLYKPFLEKSSTQKFNIIIPDISFTGLKPESRKYLLENAKSIIIISDGNAQLSKFIPQYFHYVLHKEKPINLSVIKKEFNSKQRVNRFNAREYYRLSEKVKIFNFQGIYSLPLNDIFDKLEKPWAKINVHSYPTSLSKLANEEFLKDSDYMKDILSVNNLMNSSESKPKTLKDLMSINSTKYDPTKKNMVFIGSSLFRTGAYQNNELLRKNAIAYFEKIEKLYPKSEYNYLFKLHPYYKENNSLDYVKMLLGKEDVSDYIILNPSISWENMLSLDYWNLLNNNDAVLFKKENNKIKPNMKLFSLQATTTALITTMQFLEQTLDDYKTLEAKREVIDPKIIPINENINIINRENESNKDYYQINYDNLYSIYKWYLTSQDFYPITEFKRLSEFLENN